MENFNNRVSEKPNLRRLKILDTNGNITGEEQLVLIERDPLECVVGGQEGTKITAETFIEIENIANTALARANTALAADGSKLDKMIVLSAANWINNRQVISEPDLNLTKSIDMGLPMPTSRANIMAVADSELIIVAIDSEMQTITFDVTIEPQSDLIIILRGEVK